MDRVQDLGDDVDNPLHDRIAVVGAGWAGLAASVALAGAGVPVTLFEASRLLGGRARRVSLHGANLDNGQHIFIGAYRETLALMRKVGIDPETVLLRLPLEVRYAEGFRFRAGDLPYPLDLAWGLLRSVGFSEALSAIRFMQRLKRARWSSDRSVSQWLDDEAQQGALRTHLWEPLCVAALNTPTSRASARVFARVLRDGLTGGRGSSDLLLARTDLGRLFPDPAAEFIRAHGGEIELGAPVRRIVRDASGFRLDERAFSSVILACGPQHASRLLAAFPELAPTRALIDALEYEPILTCYLQYAPSVSLASPMMAFARGTLQWLFDRGQLDAAPGLLAGVISASGPHVGLTHEQLLERIEAELRAYLGLPAPVWSRLITEKRATFSCRPSLVRPAARTAVAGLVLAGDYVAGDYPGTLESAVRSGIAAAALLHPSASSCTSR